LSMLGGPPPSAHPPASRVGPGAGASGGASGAQDTSGAAVAPAPRAPPRISGIKPPKTPEARNDSPRPPVLSRPERAPEPPKQPRTKPEITSFDVLARILSGSGAKAQGQISTAAGGPPLPPPPPPPASGGPAGPPPPMPGTPNNGARVSDTYSNIFDLRVPGDMTPIHDLINSAEKNRNPNLFKPTIQSQATQKAIVDVKAENNKEMRKKQRILNALKRGKVKEVANIYAKVIRSLVKVMYRASTTQDDGELNVSRVYDCVQQVKDAIGTHYVTEGAEPQKCDCDEAFAIVFSREKDTGRKWKMCDEQPKTGDEIVSEDLYDILRKGQIELTEQQTRDLKVFIQDGKRNVCVDLMSNDFIKVVIDDTTISFFTPELREYKPSNQQLKSQQDQQDIKLDVLIQNTERLLQEAKNNQTQNTMTEYDDLDIDPNLTWPEELYNAISMAFNKKKELTTLFLRNKEWIDEFLGKHSTSNKSTRTEIFEKVKTEEKAIAIAGYDSTKFISDITKTGWYFNNNNFKVLRMIIVNLCSALLKKINISETNEQQLTNDLALALRFCWIKCCQGANKGVDKETHKLFLERGAKLTELLKTYELTEPLKLTEPLAAGFFTTLPGWTPEPQTRVAVSNHKPHRVSRMFICR
jgi:hypothetical protein